MGKQVLPASTWDMNFLKSLVTVYCSDIKCSAMPYIVVAKA